MNCKFFLSYRRSDDTPKDSKRNYGPVKYFKDLLIKTYNKLYNTNIEFFMDIESINAGDKWKIKTNEAIKNSAGFIAILSKKYVESEECRFEWKEFYETTYQKPKGAETPLFIIYNDIPGWTPKISNNHEDKAWKNKYEDEEAINFILQNQEEFNKLHFHEDIDPVKITDENAHLDFRSWDGINIDKIDEELSNKDFQNLGQKDWWFLNREQKMLRRLIVLCKNINERLYKIELAKLCLSNLNFDKTDSHFVGRNKDVEFIETTLKGNKICSLNAFGGMGKTAIAVKYASVIRNEFVTGGIWFIDYDKVGNPNHISPIADNKEEESKEIQNKMDRLVKECYKTVYENNRTSLSSLNKDDQEIELRKLGLKPPIEYLVMDKEIEKLNTGAIFNSLRTYCEKRAEILQTRTSAKLSIENHRILFIIDNMNDAEMLSKDYFKSIASGWFNLLITTRLKPKDIQSSDINSKVIEPLNENESNSIFKSYYSISKPQNKYKFYQPDYQSSLTELINNCLKGYPLPTVLVAAHLGINTDINPSKYMKYLDDIGLKVGQMDIKAIQKPGLPYHDNNYEEDENSIDKPNPALLRGIVRIFIEHLEKLPLIGEGSKGELAVLILHYSIYFHNEYINVLWIKDWIMTRNENKFETGLNSEELFESAMIILKEYQILSEINIESKGSYHTMHKLVQIELKKELSRDKNGVKILEGIYENLRAVKFNSNGEEYERDWEEKNNSINDAKNLIELFKGFTENNIIPIADVKDIILFISSLPQLNLNEDATELLSRVQSILIAESKRFQKADFNNTNLAEYFLLSYLELLAMYKSLGFTKNKFKLFEKVELQPVLNRSIELGSKLALELEKIIPYEEKSNLERIYNNFLILHFNIQYEYIISYNWDLDYSSIIHVEKELLRLKMSIERIEQNSLAGDVLYVGIYNKLINSLNIAKKKLGKDNEMLDLKNFKDSTNLSASSKFENKLQVALNNIRLGKYENAYLDILQLDGLLKDCYSEYGLEQLQVFQYILNIEKLWTGYKINMLNVKEFCFKTSELISHVLNYVNAAKIQIRELGQLNKLAEYLAQILHGETSKKSTKEDIYICVKEIWNKCKELCALPPVESEFNLIFRIGFSNIFSLSLMDNRTALEIAEETWNILPDRFKKDNAENTNEMMLYLMVLDALIGGYFKFSKSDNNALKKFSEYMYLLESKLNFISATFHHGVLPPKIETALNGLYNKYLDYKE
ncbi:MAG: toll/interleukin-1 receptor domain-containing protein [Chitinophagaceae bacterium]|nr:toll/interleukin-1 receptor domain-containing protein [Chitinophagaceae bacterium]